MPNLMFARLVVLEDLKRMFVRTYVRADRIALYILDLNHFAMGISLVLQRQIV